MQSAVRRFIHIEMFPYYDELSRNNLQLRCPMRFVCIDLLPYSGFHDHLCQEMAWQQVYFMTDSKLYM